MSILILGVAIGLFSWLFRARKKGLPAAVNTEMPVKMNVIHKKVISGSLAPQKEVKITAQVAGIVDKLYVAVGDSVKPGTVIARIKTQPKCSNVISAKKVLHIAQIELKEAAAKYQRSQQLFEKEMLSPEQYETHVKLWEKAREEEDCAQKQLDLLLKGQVADERSFSNIVTTTIGGVVVDLPYKEGSEVTDSSDMKGGSTLAVIADMGVVFFQGEVGEMDVAYLSKGMQFDIIVHAAKGKKIPVTLTKVAPKSVDRKEEAVPKFPIEGILQLKKGEQAILRSGYTAMADIILEQAMDVWAIKEKSLHKDENTSFVWVYENNQKVKKPVELGVSDGIYVEVKEGLTESDLVIVE